MLPENFIPNRARLVQATSPCTTKAPRTTWTSDPAVGMTEPSMRAPPLDKLRILIGDDDPFQNSAAPRKRLDRVALRASAERVGTAIGVMSDSSRSRVALALMC